MPTANRTSQTVRRQANARMPVDRHLAAALAKWRLSGAVTGTQSQWISVRVDPGVMRAAAARLRLTNPSDVVDASLAVAPDRFKAWWSETLATLPGDFEVAV